MIRGIVLRVVRMFSAVPDGRTPLILRRHNRMITSISANRILLNPKKKTYCPIPAAIVAIPNIEDIKYNKTSITDVFFPNTFDSIEKKAPVDGYLEEAHARESMTQVAETAAISHAIRELGPAMPAAIPGTTNIPEPIVPPTPRLTSSKTPRDLL
jgi:hypothetical protein